MFSVKISILPIQSAKSILHYKIISEYTYNGLAVPIIIVFNNKLYNVKRMSKIITFLCNLSRTF